MRLRLQGLSNSYARQNAGTWWIHLEGGRPLFVGERAELIIASRRSVENLPVCMQGDESGYLLPTSAAAPRSLAFAQSGSAAHAVCNEQHRRHVTRSRSELTTTTRCALAMACDVCSDTDDSFDDDGRQEVHVSVLRLSLQHLAFRLKRSGIRLILSLRIL